MIPVGGQVGVGDFPNHSANFLLSVLIIQTGSRSLFNKVHRMTVSNSEHSLIECPMMILAQAYTIIHDIQIIIGPSENVSSIDTGEDIGFCGETQAAKSAGVVIQFPHLLGEYSGTMPSCHRQTKIRGGTETDFHIILFNFFDGRKVRLHAGGNIKIRFQHIQCITDTISSMTPNDGVQILGCLDSGITNSFVLEVSDMIRNSLCEIIRECSMHSVQFLYAIPSLCEANEFRFRTVTNFDIRRIDLDFPFIRIKLTVNP